MLSYMFSIFLKESIDFEEGMLEGQIVRNRRAAIQRIMYPMHNLPRMKWLSRSLKHNSQEGLLGKSKSKFLSTEYRATYSWVIGHLL